MWYPVQSQLWRRDGTRTLFFVYILSNTSMRVYTGITNDLSRRYGEHLRGECRFTSRYHFDRVVYFEAYELVRDAIRRETAIKNLSRAAKIALVKALNPSWRNLLETCSASL